MWRRSPRGQPAVSYNPLHFSVRVIVNVSCAINDVSAYRAVANRDPMMSDEVNLDSGAIVSGYCYVISALNLVRYNGHDSSGSTKCDQFFP